MLDRYKESEEKKKEKSLESFWEKNFSQWVS